MTSQQYLTLFNPKFRYSYVEGNLGTEFSHINKNANDHFRLRGILFYKNFFV